MSCKFHVGQKVVCVDAKNSSWQMVNLFGLISWRRFFSELVEGKVYTVSDVFVGTDIITGHDDVGLMLAEVVQYRNTGFRASRFRPVIERKTDISVFKAMLKPKKLRVDA